MNGIVEAWIYDQPSARLTTLVECDNGEGITFVHFILDVIPLDDIFLLHATLERRPVSIPSTTSGPFKCPYPGRSRMTGILPTVPTKSGYYKPATFTACESS